jgi:peptidyl-dipeptidase Dcp
MDKIIIVTSLLLMVLGCTTKENKMNPFFEEYQTPFQIPPFEKIEFSHYVPAFEAGMQEQLKDIDKITSNGEAPSFENTIVELERTGKILDKVSNVFFNLLGSNTNDDMDQLAVEISPKLSAHGDSILLNKELFDRVEAVYQSKSDLNLNTEQNRLLDETYKRFIRSGANLDENGMKRLTAINQSLSSLSVNFDQNVLKETNGFSLIIENEEDLSGLPAEEIRQAEKLAQSEGHDGKWVFKPTRVSMYPFITYSDQRELREQLYNSYVRRGNNDNEYDNKAIILEMIALRIEKANLMGFDNHADYVLDNTMAQNTDRVNGLLQKIWKPGLETAQKEAQDMQDLIQKEGGNFKLAAWDWWHYAEKIRQSRVYFNEEEV